MQQSITQTKLFKFTCILITLYVVGLLLFIGADIIIPIIFAAFFAILLNPVVVFLVRKKVPRTLAIFIVIFITIVTISGLFYFLSMQIASFSESLPQLEKKLGALMVDGIKWTSDTFHIKTGNIQQWLSDLKGDFLKDSGSYIGNTLSSLTGFVGFLVLLPVYTIMIMYYEPLFIVFIQKVIPEHKHTVTKDIINETKSVMQSYLSGLMIEAVILTIINAAGLLILGIDYAILWAVIGALLNIIPYIGIIIATIFPFTMALITKEPIYGLFVILVYVFAQFIDNNIVVPKVVASRVKLNALVSVIIVIIGGSLWGVSGMFLSIPLLAVAKIIFDRIPNLKPYGYLLGNVMPVKAAFFSRHRKIKKLVGLVK